MLAALADPAFGSDLPPLSTDAKELMGMANADRENPRVLALVAQRDPIYLGRLMSFANSAAYANLDMTTSADAAIRRLGVAPTYALLLTSALAVDLESHPEAQFCRAYLMRHAMSLTATASRLGQWLELSEEQATTLWLSSLLYSTGIFAGLQHDGALGEAFKKGLGELMTGPSLDLTAPPELAGFLLLSAHVGAHWHMADKVVQALLDAAKEQPTTQDGILLRAANSALRLGAQGLSEAPVLRRLREQGLTTTHIDQDAWISVSKLFR